MMDHIKTMKNLVENIVWTWLLKLFDFQIRKKSEPIFYGPMLKSEISG